ncbi:PKD domain-containing protein [Cryobacterium levicorallinum]|uniref:PKD domain-containing protein n=1 Tax=Cryobacterium levicorallinum TaxID=995038 RepID=UPI0011139C8A|nr:PKD domain-containing protein [Cryobacterium levicorallinum]
MSHKSTTEPSQWVPCNTGGLSDIVERHPQLLPTIAAPPAACPLCSAETIIHISDLQNFPAPIAPTGMEPNGWAIVGLAANFWTGASTHISEGHLLGQPAQVMFTPIGYHWNFGDGNTATSPTGGASWEALGLPEFTTTDTSHKYTAQGTYSIVLTIKYQADYSFGDQGWRPVDGTITMPSAPFTVMAANESTVLVAEDCLTNPHGPGC